MNLQGLPYFEQYFDFWSVEPNRFMAAYNHLRSLDLSIHMASGAPEASAKHAAGYGQQFERAEGGIAMIRLNGTLMKQESSFTQSTSTVLARRQLRAAVNDPEVKAICLHIDSPGGTVAGTRDLADDVAAAAQKKTVVAYIEDLGASAAYWIASQANKVYANPTGLVGSIGTYAVVYDYSKAAEMAGIEVFVIKAGDFKGAGVEGTKITAEQLDDFQRIVNELNDHFLRGIASGRNMNIKQARELADGRIHMAQPAKGLGLIDGVQSFDETIRQLSKSKGTKPMSTTETTPAPPVAEQKPADVVPAPAAATATGNEPASYEQLKAGLPGASADFICKQMENKATLAQAQQAWMAEQSRQLADANVRIEKAEAAVRKPGVAPLTSGTKPAQASAVEGDPIQAFQDAVDAKVKAGMPRHLAHAEVCRKQPELRDAMVAAHNLEHRNTAAA